MTYDRFDGVPMIENTTFIVPLRIESTDRLRNVIVSTCYLLDNTDAQVIIKEVDTASTFAVSALPQIRECVGARAENLKHVFEESKDEVFHRTRILNDMTMMADTPVVVNYDCDILLPLTSYEESEKLIMDGTYDVVYPYGDGNWQYQVFADDDLVSRFINEEYKLSVLREKSKVYDAKYGFCQFFNRQKYIEGGLENEHFIAYGYEDNERWYRFNTMGYHVGRLDAHVYHLEHARTANSWFTNPYIQQNKDLYERIQGMNREELHEYYKEVDYVKLRA